ncbi:Protein IN2-1 homolog A [Linum perenne]
MQVPALEHNNEVIGESLDLMKYIDSQFQGPSLFPDDPAKRDFAEELLSSVGSFYKAVTSTLKGEADGAGRYSVCSIHRKISACIARHEKLRHYFNKA